MSAAPERAGSAPSAADPITQILKEAHSIAVVGLSSKRFRPSYGVAEYLPATESFPSIPTNRKCSARNPTRAWKKCPTKWTS
jgi:predicted CoA-binding protein